jgi:hypothetical protein
MTIGRVARLLTRLLTLIVLAASGTYLIVYLYRWEWNRALVAGIFFVAAEVAFAASMLLARLDRIASRLSPAQQRAADRTYRRLRETPGEPREPFAWLRPDRGTFVFVPVLLGAGVLLSALAHLVQRIATSSVDPIIDRDVSLRMGELAPPEGGLVPPPGGDRTPAHLLLDAPPAPSPDRRRQAVSWTVAALIGALAVAWAVQMLAEATQARPDAAGTGYVTVIDLEVSSRGANPLIEDDVEALVVACEPRLPDSTRVRDPLVIGPGEVRLVVEPALGDTASRRFRGCLEDATLDLIDAHLVDMRRLPAAGVSPDGEAQ